MLKSDSASCAAVGQHPAVGECSLHTLPEGPGSGQHSEQIHPVGAADHRDSRGKHPEMPKGS